MLYIKRILDIVLSLVALFFLSLLILIIAFLIKLKIRENVFLRQKRMGKYGGEFYIYKFRTMQNPDEFPDGIGKFLRKTFLDEIPQFINILKGEMSLVGPRPELFEIAKNYNKEQKRRLEIKPGLTGLWQISPYIDKPIHNHLEYDFFYIDNQSLWLDLVIISKTVILFFNKIINYSMKII